MSSAPGWHAEPFPPGGAIAAEGALNPLGRPTLSLFEVLVREAIQNSWDARANGSPVAFDVYGWELLAEEADAAAELLEEGLTDEPLSIEDSLEKRPLKFLAFADCGTHGLGGPTRADVQRSDGSRRDFVRFARNIGEPRDRQLTAGTFGFGKAVFYSASAAGAVIAYTRCIDNGREESRFIGCALDSSFTLPHGNDLRPYTGRYWWGVLEDGVVEPLRDEAADAAAAVLGIVPRPAGELGTTIVVVDPLFEEAAEDLTLLAHAVAWHAWPKLIDGPDGAPSMEVTVRWNDEQIEIPDPERTPPLDAFVTQYRKLDQGEPIVSQRPRMRLGTVQIGRRLVPLGSDTAAGGYSPPIQSPVHHIALLRSPDFIVKYLEGDPLREDFAEYAGVFEVVDDPEVDEAFAAAEPPTHDNWITRNLRGRQHTFVKVALDRLRDRMREESEPIGTAVQGVSQQFPLGRASSRFATLVSTTPGGGAGPSVPSPNGGGGSGSGGTGGAGGGGSGGSGGGGGGGTRLRVQTAGPAEFGTFRGAEVLLFPFRILAAPPAAEVEAAVTVAVDETSQREVDGPAGASAPEFLGWLGPSGEELMDPGLAADGRHGQLWRLAVAPAPDTMTLATFSLRGDG